MLEKVTTLLLFTFMTMLVRCHPVAARLSPSKLPSILAISTASTVTTRAGYASNTNTPNTKLNARNYQVKPLYDPAPAVDYVDCFWGEPFLYGGKLFYDVSTSRGEMNGVAST